MALLTRLRWRLAALRFALTVKPVMGGSPEGDPDPEPDPDPDPTNDPADPDPDPTPDPDPDPDPKEPDWKATSRKHERRAKQEKARANELAAKLKSIEESNQTEQEKAIATAREEAKAEALKESDKERRSDRLEVNITRLGSKGITIGQGDDAKTVKLADPDDAQVFIERKIAKGEIDEADLYDEDGKIQTDALTEALTDLLEEKPHLAAADGGGSRSLGDAGGGRGAATKTDLETQSIEEHLKGMQKTGK